MNYFEELSNSGNLIIRTSDYHRTMIPYHLSRSGLSPDKVIVNIEIESGHYLVPLSENGYERLVALNSADTYFNHYKKMLGIECHKVNIETERIPLPDQSVDAVLAIHIIEHLHNPIILLSEAIRILKIGGKLIIITPNWRKQVKTFWRDPTHVHPYDKISLTRLVKSYGFTLERIVNDGSRLGIDRLKLFKIFPWIGEIIGHDMLLVAEKN